MKNKDSLKALANNLSKKINNQSNILFKILCLDPY